MARSRISFWASPTSSKAQEPMDSTTANTTGQSRSFAYSNIAHANPGMMAVGRKFRKLPTPPVKRSSRLRARASTQSRNICTRMAVPTPTTGVAQDCSNPSTVCPSTFQMIIRMQKYHRAKRRSLGFLFG